MSRARTIVGLILILVGISVLIDIPFFQILMAGLAIWLGLSILFRTGKTKRPNASNTNQDHFNRVLIASSMEQIITSKNFRGADLVNIFSDSEFDFSKSKGQEKITIDVVAIFGEITIIVPPSWSIETDVVEILSTLNNRVKTTNDSKSKLVIEGLSVFSEIIIKHS